MVNEKFFQGLTAGQQKAVTDGVRIARDIHRKLTSEQDLAAREILAKLGMQVSELSGRDRRLSEARAATPWLSS
jgi:TRAP-type transport system periplasmic protein